MKLPEAFVREITPLIGMEEYAHFVAALEEEPRVAFRANAAKGACASSELKRVEWSSVGRFLEERPTFTFDPLFHGGAYYVQEPSSMFVEQALKTCGRVERMLDLCASPGGKSTLFRSLLPPDSVLVCNEPQKLRAQVLLENLLKWGHPEVMVTNNYPRDFAVLRNLFDVIAVDAPCSGEGMFRKDNPALNEWSEQNVNNCAARQREIVSEVWPSLREGGYLIYSTCTYNLEEDEKNVAFFCQSLGAEVVEIPIPAVWQVTGNLLKGSDFPVYRFLPHRTEGEGFFLALLRKKCQDDVESNGSRRERTKKGGIKFFPLSQSKLKNWLQCPERFVTIDEGETTYALSPSLAEIVNRMGGRFHLLSAGIPLAVSKGNKTQPHEALALTTALQRGSFAELDVDRDVALQYLRRLSLTLPEGSPRGYVLLTYRNLPLGFVNNLGAHANNLYPQNWKIRSGYTPDDVFKFIEFKKPR